MQKMLERNTGKIIFLVIPLLVKTALKISDIT